MKNSPVHSFIDSHASFFFLELREKTPNPIYNPIAWKMHYLMYIPTVKFEHFDMAINSLQAWVLWEEAMNKY